MCVFYVRVHVNADVLLVIKLDACFVLHLDVTYICADGNKAFLIEIVFVICPVMETSKILTKVKHMKAKSIQWQKGAGNCTRLRAPKLVRHDDVIKWKHFPRYWSLWGESTGHRWIPLTKSHSAEL